MPTPATDRPVVDLPDKDRYTYDDYKKLPEGAPYELIREHLVMSPSPSVQHQRIVRRFNRVLDEYVQAHDIGEMLVAPIDVHLSDETVVQPDVLYVSPERADRIEREEIAGAPDVIVEVLPSSTAHRDLTEKKQLYDEHGVREYWIVDPSQETVEVFQNTDEGFIQHARVVHEGVASSTLLGDSAVEPKNLFSPQKLGTNRYEPDTSEATE